MEMEDQKNDDMDSLFEGMVLFTPQIVDNHDSGSQSDVVQSSKDEDTVATPPVSVPSSQPLDENLFCDLTVITPSFVEASETHMPSNLSPVMTSNATKVEREEAPAVPIFRQSSRKKKRAGIRIGYGRDSQLMDDLEPVMHRQDSLSVAESSFSATISTIQDASIAVVKERQMPLPSHTSQTTQIDSPKTLPQDESVGGLKDMMGSNSERIEKHKDLNLTVEKDISPAAHEAREVDNSHTRGNDEDEGTSDSTDGKYKHIKAQISDKLSWAREQAASISSAKKESRRRRRQAAEDVQLASQRHAEIEKKLEEACEAEDFEMAERLSESLAAAEREKERLQNALRDAEAECDTIDSKMQDVLKQQIAAEEECVSLLQRFSMDATSDADSVVENVEVNSSTQMDEWYLLVEAVEAKKWEVEIESQLVNEARSTLKDSIGHLVESDVKEKEILCDRKKLLTQELEKLLMLVKEKEAEIAENDAKIAAVDKRIAEVASGFNDVQSGIDAMHEKLQAILSELESEHETLQKKKDEIDNLLFQGRNRGEHLKKLAKDSTDEAKMYQENLALRKALVASVLKVREEKLRLVKTEEKILADVQNLKQEINAARASLQELSSRKSTIQQENTALKQRMLFIDKRLPELEAEKKVAATARNFKEAARLASEAKSLTAEKEDQQIKVEEFTAELGKIEEEINETTEKLQEFETLISSKEKEAAVARFQRLKLISFATSAERPAALELGDNEEAKVLLAESEAADSEAKQLQEVHNISEDEFGNLSEFKKFVPMELLSSLDGKQLKELAAGCN